MLLQLKIFSSSLLPGPEHCSACGSRGQSLPCFCPTSPWRQPRHGEPQAAGRRLGRTRAAAAPRLPSLTPARPLMRQAAGASPPPRPAQPAAPGEEASHRLSGGAAGSWPRSSPVLGGPLPAAAGAAAAAWAAGAAAPRPGLAVAAGAGGSALRRQGPSRCPGHPSGLAWACFGSAARN